jgi:hypothetical protein
MKQLQITADKREIKILPNCLRQLLLSANPKHPTFTQNLLTQVTQVTKVTKVT